MTSLMMIMDVAPDPVGMGALVAVVLLVMGFIVLLAVGLVLFLWYRKRSMRGLERNFRSPSLSSVTGTSRLKPKNKQKL